MMVIAPDRAQRIIVAVVQNIRDWEQRVEEIADAAIPVTGNKARGLALLRDMRVTRLGLARLAGLEPDA
jgi:hypothetical protein